MRGKPVLTVLLAAAMIVSVFVLAADESKTLDHEIIWMKMGMVQDVGAPGDPDDVRADSGSVMFDDGMYKVWYSGYDGSHWRILHSTSPNGVAWTKHGVVLDLGAPGDFDDDYVMCPMVLRNDQGTYEMWYVGQSKGTYGWKIGYATSNDGINWQKHGLVFWKSGRSVAHPNVILGDDGIYRMWYSEYDRTHWRIGHATSDDGMTWIDYGVVLDVGPSGAPDSKYIYFPAVVIEPDGTYLMLYCHYGGYPADILDIQFATSLDGVNWEKKGMTLEHGEEGDYDSLQAIPTTIRIRPDGLHELFYTGYDGYTRRMMLAIEVRPELEAEIGCGPQTLNLWSRGNWITCYIELPVGYDPRDIDATTVLLNDVLSPELNPKYGFVSDEASYITDHDEDGIEERMVKFDRSEVEELLDVGNSVLLTIAGELINGIEFKGEETIRVIKPPKPHNLMPEN